MSLEHKVVIIISSFPVPDHGRYDKSIRSVVERIRIDDQAVDRVATRPCSISWIDSIDDRSQTPCFRTGATNATERRRGKAETVKVRDDASVTVERLGGRGTVDYRVSRRLAQESVAGYPDAISRALSIRPRCETRPVFSIEDISIGDRLDFKYPASIQRFRDRCL